MKSPTRRRPVMILHRARPTQQEEPIEEKERESIPEEYKKEYIEFINKLMHRMKADSIKRMLDLAMQETEE